MTIIEPTPGRIVWFWPEGESPNQKPQAAIVVGVQGTRLVNLMAFSYWGEPATHLDVPVIQEGDPKPRQRYATWMPYQLGQAKKHAEQNAASGVNPV